MEDLIAFIIKLDNGDDTECLWKSLSEYLLPCGVKSIFYRHIPFFAEESFDEKYLYTENLPDFLTGSYITEKIYQADILQVMASKESETYNWLNDDVVTSAADSQALFVNMLMKYMGNDILVFSVYGASNRSGYFCLSFNNPRKEIDESVLRRCEIACNYTHIKYSKYLASNKISAVALSTRELEIIRWVAKGKGNTVIGDIMGISRHTVDSYLRRIFIKMEVSDRTTAALKALSLGLIPS